MANPEKGEVSFQYKGKTYTLVRNLAAVRKLQKHFNTTDKQGRVVVASINEIDRLVREESVEHIVALFWALLQKHHPEIATIEQAEELLEATSAEGIAVLDEANKKLVDEANKLAEIDPEDAAELAKLAQVNPPKAQAKHRKRRGGAFTSLREPAA